MFKNYEHQYNEARVQSSINFHPEGENDNGVSINLRECFHKYVNSRFVFPYLDFNDFRQVKFKHNYPHLIYDLIHYLGGILELIKVDKKSDINDKYKEMITKQMNRTAIMNDVNLLTKRKQKGLCRFGQFLLVEFISHLKHVKLTFLL